VGKLGPGLGSDLRLAGLAAAAALDWVGEVLDGQQKGQDADHEVEVLHVEVLDDHEEVGEVLSGEEERIGEVDMHSESSGEDVHLLP